MENLSDRIKYKNLINKKGVYMISCNQYQYIGSSKNIYIRLKEHHN
jgi:predicted GIY-YIG superfamily endonuclease